MTPALVYFSKIFATALQLSLTLFKLMIPVIVANPHFSPE